MLEHCHCRRWLTIAKCIMGHMVVSENMAPQNHIEISSSYRLTHGKCTSEGIPVYHIFRHTIFFNMDYIDKSHYVIVCPTNIHTKSIPQGIPVSTNSMFHGAHELMLNPTQPAGGSPRSPRPNTPEVSTMSPVGCACVRRWDDGSCRRAAVETWRGDREANDRKKEIKRGKWKRTVCITIYN